MSIRRNQLYLGLMILGAVALFVDRVILPADVTAASLPLAGLVVAPDARDVAEQVPIPELPFPDTLRSFRSDLPVRDLFLPPALREGDNSGPGYARGRDGRGRRGSQPGRLGRDEFAAQYTLSGVLIDQGLRIAVINGHWMRIGRSADGCTLAGIAGTEVRFACYDGEVTLKLGPADEIPDD